MAKSTNVTMKVQPGMQVAFNTLKDAIWFDVLEVDGLRIVIREHGTNYVKQVMDRSLVKQLKA